MPSDILIFLRHYLPGYRFGGPLRSVANLVEHLGADYRFRIVTLDRDMGEDRPYPDIQPDHWQARDGAEVIYLSEPPRRSSLTRLLQETPHDLIFLNSAFDPRFSMLPLIANRGRRTGRAPVLLAPRGEFAPGALALKAPKKQVFMALARGAGLWRDVTWQATAETEATDIAHQIGPQAQICLAANLPSVAADDPPPPPPSDVLRGAFLSRISPKKNLTGALDILAQVKAPVRFTIYGPKEDAAYWAECEARITRLPAHIEVVYGGSKRPEDVRAALAGHDFFLLPTLSENFGHAIVDAMWAGLHLLISDQTPWRDLAARGVGADLPLAKPARFVAEIERLAGLAPEARMAMRRAVLDMAREISDLTEVRATTRAMFDTASSEGPR